MITHIAENINNITQFNWFNMIKFKSTDLTSTIKRTLHYTVYTYIHITYILLNTTCFDNNLTSE